MRDIKHRFDVCKKVVGFLDECTKAKVSRTPFYSDEKETGATIDGSVCEEKVKCRECGGYTLYRFDGRMEAPLLSLIYPSD